MRAITIAAIAALLLFVPAYGNSPAPKPAPAPKAAKPIDPVTAVVGFKKSVDAAAVKVATTAVKDHLTILGKVLSLFKKAPAPAPAPKPAPSPKGHGRRLSNAPAPKPSASPKAINPIKTIVDTKKAVDAAAVSVATTAVKTHLSILGKILSLFKKAPAAAPAPAPKPAPSPKGHGRRMLNNSPKPAPAPAAKKVDPLATAVAAKAALDKAAITTVTKAASSALAVKKAADATVAKAVSSHLAAVFKVIAAFHAPAPAPAPKPAPAPRSHGL